MRWLRIYRNSQNETTTERGSVPLFVSTYNVWLAQATVLIIVLGLLVSVFNAARYKRWPDVAMRLGSCGGAGIALNDLSVAFLQQDRHVRDVIPSTGQIIESKGPYWIYSQPLFMTCVVLLFGTAVAIATVIWTKASSAKVVALAASFALFATTLYATSFLMAPHPDVAMALEELAAWTWPATVVVTMLFTVVVVARKRKKQKSWHDADPRP